MKYIAILCTSSTSCALHKHHYGSPIMEFCAKVLNFRFVSYQPLLELRKFQALLQVVNKKAFSHSCTTRTCTKALGEITMLKTLDADILVED